MSRVAALVMLGWLLAACGGGGGGGDAGGSGSGLPPTPPGEAGAPASTATTWEDATWQQTGGTNALVWQ